MAHPQKPTIIKANCPSHGEVALSPDKLRLVKCLDGETRYWFPCDGCSEQVCKIANDYVAGLLVQAGVELVDAAALHPEQVEDRSLPVFTRDDLLEFHLMLEDDALISMALDVFSLDV